MSPRRFILDTDLGSDCDDLIALAILARLAPDELVGCSTVYGDTVLRARMVRHVLDRLGSDEAPVIAGATTPLSERPVWVTGHEADGWSELPSETTISDCRNDPAALSRLGDDGPVELIAIGPLTNVARSLRADAAFAERVERIFLMGGYFAGPRIEHNFRCDPIAAHEVFESGIPIVVAGLETTLRSWYGPSEIRKLNRVGDPICSLVADQMARWLDLGKGGLDGDSPHDAVCVLSALRPDLFETTPCRITVSPAGDDAGLSVAVPGEAHHLIVDLDLDAVNRTIIAELEGER